MSVLPSAARDLLLAEAVPVWGRSYVSNTSANSILRFANASAASGNVVPNATISGSATQLTSPQYLAVDVSNNSLYVANQGASSVLIFDAASIKNGNVAPSRFIMGSNTGLISPVDVQLDSSRNLLYVADGAQVLVFGSASTVTCNVAPVRTLSVGFSIAAMLVDSSGDRLFLANGTSNAIDVYDSASTLNNTVSPNRMVSGSQTQLSTPSGMQIDSSGRLVVSDFGRASITMYANAATREWKHQSFSHNQRQQYKAQQPLADCDRVRQPALYRRWNCGQLSGLHEPELGKREYGSQ